MGRFNEFIKSATPCSPSLPLLHTCDGYHFREIVDSQYLQPSHCRVFGENLLYLFYGRPSYRTAKDSKATSMPAFFPVSIMLTPEAVPAPKRIAPFDTGAFESDRFSEHMHPNMRREDFLLDPTPEMPSRVVSRFYGHNKAYFAGTPQAIEIPPIEFEAVSYYNLITSKHVSDYDDRNCSIEIQADTTLTLDSKNVLLIVLPSVFLDVQYLRERIVVDWQAQVRSYEVFRGNANEYTILMYQEVTAYLRDNGML